MKDESFIQDQTVRIEFPITIEVRDRAQFQKEGHMLFALYGPGETEDDPPIRREWEGDQLFIATMKHNGQQVLRVMSDSQTGAEDAMTNSILNTLYANARARAIQDFDYQQFLQLNEQRNRFAEFIEVNYSGEIHNSNRFATVFDVAIFYLRKERRRFVVRLASMFRKRKAVGQ